MRSEIRALCIIWSVNEYPVFFLSSRIFFRALLSEGLEQAKRLVNEYMCSMNYYDYYGLYYCCNYFN